MNKLNIAIVGYGGMGRYHIHDLIPREYYNIQGIYDIDSDSVAVAQAQGLRIYTSYELLVKDEQVDCVLIATPNDSHRDLAIQALSNGKHVICEKPVALSTEELYQILEVADKQNCVFMVHQNRRWDPDFLIVRKIIQEKLIGNVFHIESRVHGANGIPGDWRHEKAKGGGMLLDWGVHLIDQLFLIDSTSLVQEHMHLSYVLGDEVDDGFTSYYQFKSGLTALVEVGTTNYIKLPRWYIQGTEGTAVIYDWDNSGEIIIRQDHHELRQLIPIQAGVGLTKTMAPPSEEAIAKLSLPEPLEMPMSFYENFYHVVINNLSPIVKNSEVNKVLNFIEQNL